MSVEPFFWPVRVYYEDTDSSGVVYHASYLRYFERARTEWVRALGFTQERLRLEQGIAFTVASMDLEFLRPARLDDELEVTLTVAEHRRASLTFAQTVRYRGQVDGVLARAQVRVACVDAVRFRPRSLPDEFKQGGEM